MLHLVAATTWIGGMLAAGLAVTFHAALTSGSVRARQALAAVRGGHRRITTPAMLLAIGLGSRIALHAGWLAMPWLRIKLVLVVALAALHGMLDAMLRRMAHGRGPHRPPAVLRLAAPITFFIALFVVVLAVTKPP